MITAKQCEAAAELLIEREEIADQLARMRRAKRVRVEYEVNIGQVGSDERSLQFVSGPALSMTAATRKLLMGGVEEALAAIDDQLRALGVEPPPAESTS